MAASGSSPMSVDREISGACPLDCPDTCSWVVTVRNGEATALRGDPRHPYTRGALCAKVHRYLEYTRSPDRLLHPQRRIGRKGAGRFTRISWDEALDEIAARWNAIIARHGPQAIWPYVGSGSMGMLQGVAGGGRRLWNVLGTSQHAMTICTIAGGFGTGYTLGDNRVGMDPETFGDSKLIFLWGTNTLTTNHHLWKYIEAARREGAHVVDRSHPDAHGRGRRRACEPDPGHRCRPCPGAAPRRRVAAEGGPRVHRGAHDGLGALPPANPGVPAGARGRYHGGAV